MKERKLHGLAASSGVGLGRVVLLDAPAAPGVEAHRGTTAESQDALAALDRLERELQERATRLRDAGLTAEAEILEANALMALDPVLREEVRRLCASETAASALLSASERQAAVLAALPDPMLAARASDVRELGRRAARRLTAPAAPPKLDGPSVVVADDLGPVDVADLRE